ncbi:hypothetical protein OHA72_19925 [Dactylosporangium sp. NBC_01737]|uniref:hypothetical protein n=1 Tax=Dactylosporangium sp. NBC_01737 TaxID=2975959 RepID=UPI002E0E5A1D|nr:hypothetical protein OHA72_19925 [Dactylosporangium sp. NBC_01737]
MSTTLDATRDPAAGPGEPPVTTGRRRERGVAPAPLVPLAAGLTGIAFTLRFYGVSLPTTLAFAGWLTAGVVLPGLLLWRTLRGRSGWLVADVVAGAAVGYVVEVLAYVAARAAGVPLLVLAWPAAMIGACLVVPRLRKAWRGPADPARTPALWAWSMLLVVGVLVLRSVRMFRSHGLGWPVTGPSDADTPFHLALIAEARQHMPMQAPWVSGEPLVYHWFVYPEMAATSWVTGIDPLTLLVRLTPLPMLAGTLLLVAVLARRLTGGWWTGPAAAAVTLLVLAPDPYGWPHYDGWFGFGAYEDGSMFRMVAWTSPTQTFGALLFAAVVLVLLTTFDGHVSKGTWVLLTLLLAGLAGAKSPYLPLLTGALVLMVLVRLAARRGLHRPALLAAALTAACAAAAQVVLYDGGANQGLVVRPLATMDGFVTVAATWTGYTGAGTPAGHARVAAGLTVLCWLFMWAGVLALGRSALEPPVLLLLAIGAGGMAGVLLFGHPGGSQSYLIVSARPYLALASVAGLAAVAGAMTRARGGVLALAATAGATAVLLLRRHDTVQPAGPGLGWELARPYLVLAGLTALVAVAGLVRRDRRAVAVVVALCAGFGCRPPTTRPPSSSPTPPPAAGAPCPSPTRSPSTAGPAPSTATPGPPGAGCGRTPHPVTSWPPTRTASGPAPPAPVTAPVTRGRATTGASRSPPPAAAGSSWRAGASPTPPTNAPPPTGSRRGSPTSGTPTGSPRTTPRSPTRTCRRSACCASGTTSAGSSPTPPPARSVTSGPSRCRGSPPVRSPSMR